MGYTAKEFLETVDTIKNLVEDYPSLAPFEIRDLFLSNPPDVAEDTILSILCDELDDPFVIWTDHEMEVIEYIIYRLRDGN